MTAAQNARLWAEEIGAAGYIAKPFGIDELLETVRNVSEAGGADGASPDAQASYLERARDLVEGLVRGSRGSARPHLLEI
jgi:DNA-binding response OmpR family regulator